MPAPDHPTLPTPCYRGCGRMLRCGLCMGYGARARVQVGIRTEVEPVWGHTPSIAPISLPSAALGPLPCAHLALNPPSRCEPNAVFYPDLRHRGRTIYSRSREVGIPTDLMGVLRSVASSPLHMGWGSLTKLLFRSPVPLRSMNLRRPGGLELRPGLPNWCS